MLRVSASTLLVLPEFQWLFCRQLAYDSGSLQAVACHEPLVVVCGTLVGVVDTDQEHTENTQGKEQRLHLLTR